MRRIRKMTARRLALLISINSVAAFAQNTAPRLEFEVASIRASAEQSVDRTNVGLKIDGSQVRCNHMALRDYVAMAYGVQYYQISGPDWMASQRFDIAAKLPAGAGGAQVPAMLVALLTDRFRMAAHKETKDFPVYALVRGKGELKLKESQPDPAPDSPDGGRGARPVDVAAGGGRGGVTVSLGQGATFSVGDNRLEGRKINMPSFASGLSRFLDRPAIDMTGLAKTYDFTLNFSPEDFTAMMIRAALAAGVVMPPQAMKALESSSGDSIFAAVEALGLKLEGRKAPLEVVTIDHIEKTPTEN
jgi:uncharacterized protein (TIGR03435 family)